MSGTAVLLGSATSTGVPMIGCNCDVCCSTDPHNRRTRTSLFVQIDGVRVLVDTATDLREQALRERIPGVDLVLFTHAHADHVHGIDDLRMFNFLQLRSIPCWASADTAETLRERFPYIFRPGKTFPSATPMLELRTLGRDLPCGTGRIVCVPIDHGPDRILGFRFGSLAYLTDISALPRESRALLLGIDTLIIGALRYEPHPTHMTVPQALALAADLGVRRAVLTHMGHTLDYRTLRRELPPWAEPGYDGLRVPFSWT